MEGEGFQKTSKGVSVRTAYHRDSGHSGKAQIVLENGKLDGRGQPTCSAARTLSLTEGKTVKAFLSGMECRRQDTIVSPAGHYKVSEGHDAFRARQRGDWRQRVRTKVLLAGRQLTESCARLRASM